MNFFCQNSTRRKKQYALINQSHRYLKRRLELARIFKWQQTVEIALSVLLGSYQLSLVTKLAQERHLLQDSLQDEENQSGVDFKSASKVFSKSDQQLNMRNSLP